ncbi:hypothetical protein FMM05_08350 [Flavobacterium zepuense]|uniref:Uncharacterized protein n=1 Tax=Flavobacterium zepuense TaxID=2593302 RepID=A0A552V499_9FLAO|nr:hypothetical protein [Flavobacterium zepuense]TRW25304.1 hypothetical protein FMM05_08350 [Flavobacterium zepuense]
MKPLYNTIYAMHALNAALVILTILLYIFGGHGLMVQCFLGIFQPLAALLLPIGYFKKLNKRTWLLLLYYWIAVGIWAISVKPVMVLNSTYSYLMAFYITPMLIACYFVYVTYKINKHIQNQE